MKAKLLILSFFFCGLSKAKNIAAYFTLTEACHGEQTYFTDLSLSSNGPIKSWLWDFGDGSMDTNQNTSYTYKLDGNYNVKLVVTNTNGDKDSIVMIAFVFKQPKADFEVVDFCEYDSMVCINKSSNATSYKWKFGDGNTSTKESPKHFYKFYHNANVTLAAYNINGCKDSITKFTKRYDRPIFGFDYTYSGDTFNFKPKQAGNKKYRWLFGDGDSALAWNTNHIYSDGKSKHTVCLKVTNAGGCISETCKEILIGKVSQSGFSGFKIYPNPNAGNFTVEIEYPERDLSVEVYNMLGGKVEMVGMVEKVAKVIILDLNIASGIYLVKVRNGEVVYFQKVSIAK